MKSLPKTGLYASTNKEKPLRIYITEVNDVEEDEDFYLVNMVDEESKNDEFAMSRELDNEEWESLVKECGLEFQG